MTIGEKIKEIRQNIALTLNEVSEKCGISTSKLTYYENNKGLPTIPTLQKIASGLDCTIFDIIDEPFGRKQDRCIHAEKCMFYNKKLENSVGK